MEKDQIIAARVDVIYAVERNKSDKDRDSLLALGFALKDNANTILAALDMAERMMDDERMGRAIQDHYDSRKGYAPEKGTDL